MAAVVVVEGAALQSLPGALLRKYYKGEIAGAALRSNGAGLTQRQRYMAL